MRRARAGFVPARHFTKIVSAAAAFMLAAAPVSASGAAPLSAAGKPLGAVQHGKPTNGQTIADFYRVRGGRPLWLASPGAAEQLLKLLSSADLDGLDVRRYPVDRLTNAVNEARTGDMRAVNRAEAMLSEAFVAYAGDLRNAPDVGIIYVDRELVPVAPRPRALLESVAAAPSLQNYLESFGWMNPLYGQLRRALAAGQHKNPSERAQIALNLERARTLPSGKQRYIIVNAAAQQLEMYENGQPVDSMRVVVGKPKYPTPMMAAFIRFANLNPYWYVPSDLASERIAPNVLKQGQRYLNNLGYDVVSDFVDNPAIIDPSTIDWKAVAEGREKILIRQRPGPHNSMGRMKFMFPNWQGVYLHDNPERELFSEASRLYSGGCVRLEDAARLGEWLFGRPLVWEGAGPEEKVPLDRMVPVYITYLTAVPSGGSIAFFDDVYGRDAARLAEIDGGRIASR